VGNNEKSAARADDPRFQRSRIALLEAMTVLLDVLPVGDISITLVVEKASVTRPTFYRHFADVAEAARAAALNRLEAAIPVLPPVDPASVAGPEELHNHVVLMALPALEHLRACRGFYLRVLGEAATMSFFQALVVFLSERMMPHKTAPSGVVAEDRKTVLAGGIMWLVINWLQSGAEDAPAMAARMAQIAVDLGD